MTTLSARRIAAPQVSSAPADPSLSRQDALALSVLEEFRLIFKSARRHFQEIETWTGVGGAQLWVLAHVGGEPGIRVTGLADALAIHQSTASNLVERLVADKLLLRKRNADDQRVVRLYLTPAGKRVVQKAPGPAQGILPDALQRLPAADLVELKARLACLTKLMVMRDPKGRKTPLASM